MNEPPNENEDNLPKWERTVLNAKNIIAHEKASREQKTDRLRNARLAGDAVASPAEVPVRKKRKSAEPA